MFTADVTIMATDHPSLDDLLSDFLAELRAEPRYFGPSARSNPKPFRSLIDGLGRLAALGCDRVVGMCRVDDDGDVLLAVASGRRGHRIGTALLENAIGRAGTIGWTRMTIRTSHRNAAIRGAAEHVGAVAIDVGFGRIELLFDVSASSARVPA